MALTYQAAVEQTITAGEQIHQIVNGTATTEVTVEDGSKVPSIRKALLDNFYFKDPIAWQAGQTENVFNQLRQFTDGSWWYAPSATASNPISMGSTPVGNSLWKVYDFDAIGKLTPQIREALRRSYAEAGYNLVDGSFEAGGTVTTATDVLLYEAEGKAYSYTGTLPHTVAEGSSPSAETGMWVDRSDETLRERFVCVTNYGVVGLGDDTAVIQAAVNDAYAKGVSLHFPPLKYGMYRSRQILLPQNSLEPVKPFYMFGMGSSVYILGTDHLFSVNGDFFYDLFVSDFYFESEHSGNFASTDSKIFDTKKLIRLIVNNCSSRYVNKFFDCPWTPPQTTSDYAQSVYANNCIYRRGGPTGHFFQAPVAFDISLTDCLVEQSYNGIRVVSQPAVGNLQQVSSVRIRGGAWESLLGTAMAFGPVYQLSVDGVYFEGNATDINLSYNAGEAPHLGLSIKNCDFYLSPAQIAAGYKPIIWGASAAGSYVTGGNKSNGNLHDIAASTGIFDFSGDHASGELYNGMNANTPRATSNSPIGRVKFTSGEGQWLFNELTVYRVDDVLGGYESGKIANADLVDGERHWPKFVAGGLNPQLSPSTYSNTKWCRGSVVSNTVPSVLGAAGAQYIVAGWKCITSGYGGQSGTDRWVEMRTSTGT